MNGYARNGHDRAAFADALLLTLDARSRHQGGHSMAVAVYAWDIAGRLGFSREEQELARISGLLHDIGMVGLPDGLLCKPGAFTLEERRQMQEHSVIGERILVGVSGFEEVALVARHHHERVDGLGYPDGLKGEEIPRLARVVAVADAYTAMVTDRPYRDAMPSRVARMRLAQGVDGQFDPKVVRAFEAILAEADDAYRTAGGAHSSVQPIG